jgi:hypothetical protein
MHIVLSGQPQLADKLASPSLVQLRQRISIIHGLEPLSNGEIRNYIEHRLRVAGHTGPALFTDQAYDKIANFSDGIPRNVNNVCFNALSLACATHTATVNEHILDEVLDDLDIEKWTSAAESARETSAPASNGNGLKTDLRVTEPSAISTPAEAAAFMKQFVADMKARR